MKSLVRRVQRRMLWFGLALGIAYALLGSSRGLVVLTLSVAAAIVHLRWLASHVLSLSAPALSAKQLGSATDSGSARQETDTDATASSPRAETISPSPVENATQLDSGTGTGADRSSAPKTVAPESEDYAFGSAFGSGGSDPQNDRQSTIEGSRPSEDSGAETTSFTTKAGVIAALTRLPILLILVGGLVYVGRSNPLALALGLGTLPAAMVLEAWGDHDRTP